MESSRHQREVEEKLRDALKLDRARVQIGRISRFGLMELSRQRLRPSLEESTQIVCPRCDGHGRIRGVESLSLSALRLIEEHAMKENTGQVLVQAPARVANFLLNEKRSSVVEIELRHKVHVVVVADENLETPHLEITRIRESEMGEHAKPSYERLTEVAATPQPRMGVVVHGEEPAVSGIQRATPMPQREEVETVHAPVASPASSAPAAASGGLLGRLFGWFRATPAPEPTLAELTQPQRTPQSGHAQRRDRTSDRRPDASRSGARRNGHDRDRDGELRRGRQQGQQQSKGAQPKQNKSRNDDAQRQARPAQKPTAPAASKPATESREQDAKPTRGESANAPQQDAQQRPAVTKPTPAPGVGVEIAGPVENVVTGGEGPPTPAAAADAAGAGKRRRGRRGGRRRKHANGVAQDGATPTAPRDIDDEDADRNGAPQAARPSNARDKSPRATDSVSADRAPAPAPATPAPVVHEHAFITPPLFAVPEQKPVAPAPTLPPSVAASVSSSNAPPPATPPVQAPASVKPASTTPSPAGSQPPGVASATPSPLPSSAVPIPAVHPVAPAVPKPEPVTPSLFAAPPAVRPVAQPLPRHPAIPTPRPLSGAIRPMLTPQVLPKAPSPAPEAPAAQDKPGE